MISVVKDIKYHTFKDHMQFSASIALVFLIWLIYIFPSAIFNCKSGYPLSLNMQNLPNYICCLFSTVSIYKSAKIEK